MIRPDGAPGTHCIVQLLHGVSVLAVDDDGMAHLTEEFHYAVGRATIEVVSGGIEAGEEPLAAAQRELREELGITAGEWIDLGVVRPVHHDRGLAHAVVSGPRTALRPANLEGTERYARVAVPFGESCGWCSTAGSRTRRVAC